MLVSTTSPLLLCCWLLLVFVATGIGIGIGIDIAPVVCADPLSSIGVADYSTDVHGVDTVVVPTPRTTTSVHENMTKNTTFNHTANSTYDVQVEGCISLHPHVGAWEIPFGSIAPLQSDATNLLVPVALSASHVAFSAIRLELTWMVIGHSAGVAASMAASANVAVQDVSLSELHDALLKGGQVLTAY